MILNTGFVCVQFDKVMVNRTMKGRIAKEEEALPYVRNGS